MAQFTEFGKEVKKRLIDIDKSQSWLISEVKERTGLFVDTGYLYKIFTGERAPSKVISAIQEILDMPEQTEAQRESSA